MKNYCTFFLFFCMVVLLGFSCKKEGISTLNDAALTKTASATETDSLSGFYLVVNGAVIPFNGANTRDSTRNSYAWSAWNANFGYSVLITFSGSIPVLNSYSITQYNLQPSSLQCFFALVGNNGGGSAITGVVTASQGTPNKISFTNILCPGTLSNVPTTYTVSGVLPLH